MRKWLKAFNDAYRQASPNVWLGMTSRIALALFASTLLAQQTDWILAGNRALDNGKAPEAAADFAKALDAQIQAEVSPNDLLHLRVTLATAYMEAGAYYEMEAVLQEAQRHVGPVTDGLSCAELLNAWSALHLTQGKLSVAESELQEARRIVAQLPSPGELLPTVIHNLAGVEMRTGQYPEALGHELEAIRQFESFASDNPMLIRAWASLASVQYMMGQPQEARVSMSRALASAEKTYGPSHALLAELLESDAIVLDNLKLKKAARQARAQALKIRGSQARAAEGRLAWSVREAPAMEGKVYLQSK